MCKFFCKWGKGTEPFGWLLNQLIPSCRNTDWGCYFIISLSQCKTSATKMQCAFSASTWCVHLYPLCWCLWSYTVTLMRPKTNPARREKNKKKTYWSSWMCSCIGDESWQKGRIGHAVDNLPSPFWQQCSLWEYTIKMAFSKNYILSPMASVKASLRTELWQFNNSCKSYF